MFDNCGKTVASASVRQLIAQIAMSNLRHHSLVAWQRADDSFIKLHKLAINSFPYYERFELGSQLRKAAYSIPANIVEGYARRYRRARLHFLNIAEGSLAECSYCVHAAWRLGYITEQTLKDVEADLNRVGAPLAGLIRSTRLMPLVLWSAALGCGVVIGRFLR